MLLQIVPSLPPAVNGVGDYATLLARELRARHGVESRFVVGDPAWNPPADGAEFPARAVPTRTADALARLLPSADDPTPVLLHYVPYGYAPRGCPFWLVESLRHLRYSRYPRAKNRIITIFHELSADNEPPWRTAFWLSPFQRRLGRELGRLSDHRQMTTNLVADQLRVMLPAHYNAVTALPVFSNLGEVDPPLPVAQRHRRMVVFGTRTWREAVYTRHVEDLLTACLHLGIESVLDVGAPLNAPPTDLPLPFTEHGLLQPADAPEVFGASLAGFFTYPVPYLGKSGIYAAYCAHGLVPVTTANNRRSNADGLYAGTHYLLGGQGGNPAEVARAAHAWHTQHRLQVHADEIYRAMTTVPLSPSA